MGLPFYCEPTCTFLAGAIEELKLDLVPERSRSAFVMSVSKAGAGLAATSSVSEMERVLERAGVRSRVLLAVEDLSADTANGPAVGFQKPRQFELEVLLFALHAVALGGNTPDVIVHFVSELRHAAVPVRSLKAFFAHHGRRVGRAQLARVLKQWQCGAAPFDCHDLLNAVLLDRVLCLRLAGSSWPAVESVIGVSRKSLERKAARVGGASLVHLTSLFDEERKSVLGQLLSRRLHARHGGTTSPPADPAVSVYPPGVASPRKFVASGSAASP